MNRVSMECGASVNAARREFARIEARRKKLLISFWTTGCPRVRQRTNLSRT